MQRRPEIRERRKKERRRQRLTFVLVVLAAVLVVIAGMLSSRLAPIGEIVTIIPGSHPQAEGTQLGDPNAPVLIEIYEDFQCPGCQAFTQSIEPQVVDAYVATGQARLVYRHYPIIGPESLQAAHASMCAEEQGRFWDYHDLLFANQQGENQGAFADRRLVAFAEALGLDMEAFETCFDDQRYEDQINADYAAGREVGVTATPSVFVNGTAVAGATSRSIPGFVEISAAIEAALAPSP
jgi:protein-disulfide isomerase